MEPMLSPMTALWTRSEAVMTISKEERSRGGRLRAAPSDYCASRRRCGVVRWRHRVFGRFAANRLTAGPAISAIGRRQLCDQGRDPILHLGEGHGVDDLVGDAVVILPPEMRFAPEVVELDGVQGLGDLLRIEALSLLHRSDDSEGGIGEVDARGIPLAVFLGVARLPALDLLGQGLLDKPMHPH